MAKSVDIATSTPRLFRTYALSSEASAELVPQTGLADQVRQSSTIFQDVPGYSPPAPNPATPRPTIIIQNKLLEDVY